MQPLLAPHLIFPITAAESRAVRGSPLQKSQVAEALQLCTEPGAQV